MVEIKTHYPLDVQATKDSKEHFHRDWKFHDKEHPETIRRYGLCLTQEQDSLPRNGVTITNKDKLEHYLLEIFQSQVFLKEII